MTVTDMAVKLLADVKDGKVHPNMPVFLLYGSDPCAQHTIFTWMMEAKKRDVSKEKLLNALAVLEAMSAWIPKKIPD